jgi:hypothetical protein
MSRVTTTTTPLAVAADYADALLTARKARNWLFLLIAFFLSLQLAIFLLARFNVLKFGDDGAPTTLTVATPTTQPATAPAETKTETKAATFNLAEVVRYAMPAIDFAVVGLSFVLLIVLLLLVTIMLVGRLVGVSHVTSAFIWCVVFIVWVFPWQTFLISNDDYRVRSASGVVVETAPGRYSEQPAFKWPGALYTWSELHRDYDFKNEPMLDAGWKWGRYVGMPVLGLLLLFMVQGRSGRGLRYALGESELHVDVTTRGDTFGH